MPKLTAFQWLRIRIASWVVGPQLWSWFAYSIYIRKVIDHTMTATAQYYDTKEKEQADADRPG